MSIDDTSALAPCGCCCVETAPTPELIFNRAGLSAIDYRVGTYANFLEAMKESIAASPELRPYWTARNTSDFGIAFFAMWAYVADILTFYQERIANEAFLRTALQPESVTALAALLGYKPMPGVAAEADLAFILDKLKTVQIPIGLRVQSVPGQNQKPQKFETVQAVSADAAFNQLQIFPQPQPYAPFAQASTSAVLLSPTKGLAQAIKVAMFDESVTELKTISGLPIVNTQQLLNWMPAVQTREFQSFTTRVAPYNRQFRLFGNNAPSSYMQPSVASGPPGTISWTLITSASYGNPAPTIPPGTFALDAKYNDIKPGSQFLISDPQSAPPVARLATVTGVASNQTTYGPLQDTVSWVTFGMGVTGGPAVIGDSAGQLHAFVVGDDAALWHTHQVAPALSWTPWASLGGKIDLLTVGKNQDGRLEVFARGTEDFALWHIWELSPGGAWSAWFTLGGQIDLLAVESNQDGRLEVFARSIADQSLWHIWQTAPNSGWSAWSSLGGQIDLLAAGSNADGRIEIFARGTDKALWHIWQTAPNNGWSVWSSLGGQIDLLAVQPNKDGRLEVFARGTDQALWHIWQVTPGGAWSGWGTLGGVIDLLSVTADQDGRIEVFARGSDKALWHIWQTAPNNGWSAWASFGGQIDLLAVGSNADGRIEAFARGTDQALWHIWQTAPNNGWSTWNSLGIPMWPNLAFSQVTLFELTQPPLEFYDFRYGAAIAGSTFFVPIAQMQNALSLHRTLILDDASVDPQTVNVNACNQVDADGDGEPDHWAVAFAPDLERILATSSAFFYGNVALATHGETVANEVMGSGNASQTFQTFRPKKDPITFVHQAGAPNGAADTLRLLINGVYWKEVDELYGNGSKDQVFTTAIDSQGMIVQLGDGQTGAQAPTGRSNVLATYRQGLGVVGNVASGSLKTLLDKPVGLKSVMNPTAANGGADPESLDQSRTNAPNTVRTFGRIVSLEDFADQARQFAGIAKAAAVSAWSGEDQVAYLTVAGVAGAPVIDPTYSDLVADLNTRRDPNRSMRVRSFTQINIQVAAQIDVDPTRVPADVQAAAQAALIGYLSFDNLQFGQPINLSSIYAVLQSVTGVVAADVLLLGFKSAADAASHGATADPVQDELAIFPSELAWIEDSDTDVVISSGWSPS
jgi:Baseplate J-like protein